MGHRIVFQRELLFPIETVWALVSDHCSMNRWLIPGMKVRLEPEGDPPPNGRGAIRLMTRGMYRGAEKILDFEPPHRMTYTVLYGFPIDNHLGEIVLMPTSKGTKLRWTVTFEARYYGTGFMMDAIVRRVLGQGLRRLEDVLHTSTV